MIEHVETIEELEILAKRFVHILERQKDEHHGATVVGLSGELGAGKTAFSQACARVLGVQETVTSPTFVIEKIYMLLHTTGPFNRFVHIDAYRLNNAQELAVLGFETLLRDPEALIFIEWPEHVSGIVPHDACMIRIETVSQTGRSITFPYDF